MAAQAGGVFSELAAFAFAVAASAALLRPTSAIKPIVTIPFISLLPRFD
jgi:hypothetical protein